MNRKNIKICITIIWCSGFIVSTVPILNIGYSKFVPESSLNSCSINYLSNNISDILYILVFFIGTQCVSFFVMIYYYIRIMIIVHKNRRIIDRRPSQDEKLEIIEKRVWFTIINVNVIFIITQISYLCVVILEIFDIINYIEPIYKIIAVILSNITSSLNPWIYDIINKKFRNQLNSIFQRRSRLRKAKRNIKKINDSNHTNICLRNCCINNSLNIQEQSPNNDIMLGKVYTYCYYPYIIK